MRKGDGDKGPSAQEAELEVGFDITGPLPESTEGNVWKLVGVTMQGVGACCGMKDKSAKEVLNVVKVILARVRIMCDMRETVSVRFHSDMDNSFRAEVADYCQDGAWIKTMTEGYDSNANSRVERLGGTVN